MKVPDSLNELFSSFQSINKEAFSDDAFLSNDVLSKSPGAGKVLEKFYNKTAYSRLSFFQKSKIVLSYFLHNVGHLLFALLARFYIYLLEWSFPLQKMEKAAEKSTGLLVLDTFVLLPKLVQDGRYQELYLPTIGAYAESESWDVCTLYRLYGSRNPHTLWRGLFLLSQQRNGFLDIHLLTFMDWLAVIKHIFVYPFKLYSLLEKEKKTLHSEAYGRRAIYLALRENAGQCVVIPEIRRLAAYRLGERILSSQKLKEKVLLLSWHENQTVNKAFNRGLYLAKQDFSGKIPHVGAQLTFWPPSLLNNHYDSTEYELGLYPDIILVLGSYYLPVGVGHDFYKSGPALRYERLFSNKEKVYQKLEGGAHSTEARTHNAELLAHGAESENLPICDQKNKLSASNTFGSEKKQTKVLLLLSSYPKEIETILSFVPSLLALDMDVFCKFHPMTDTSLYLNSLDSRVRLERRSLEEAVADVDFAVGSSSGSLLEAVCLKCPVLVPYEQEKFDLEMNYLPSFGRGQLWEYFDSPEELYTLFQKLDLFRCSAGYNELLCELRAMLLQKPDKSALTRLLSYRDDILSKEGTSSVIK